MRLARSRRRFGITWWWLARIPFACSLAAVPAAELWGQDGPAIEALAGVLSAVDARSYNGPFLTGAARHPDPIVRRQAALAMGRLAHKSATPTLVELLSDADTVVRGNAAFALGLLAQN